MALPRYMRWKDSTWRCSLVNERHVRLATIRPGQNRICLMSVHTFEVLLASGEIVAEDRDWE